MMGQRDMGMSYIRENGLNVGKMFTIRAVNHQEVAQGSAGVSLEDLACQGAGSFPLRLRVVQKVGLVVSRGPWKPGYSDYIAKLSQFAIELKQALVYMGTALISLNSTTNNNANWLESS